MKTFDQVLIEIAGNNALTENSIETQKLCKTINYLSTQLRVQMNAATDDKEFVKDSVNGVLEQAAGILNT